MNVNICKIKKMLFTNSRKSNSVFYTCSHIKKCRFEFNQITDIIIDLTADLVFICCISTQVHIHVNMHVCKCILISNCSLILISNCSLIQYVNQYTVQIVKNYETLIKLFFTFNIFHQ